MSDYQAKWNLANAAEEQDGTIGQLLKVAREAQDLSVPQVAEQLYLRSELIVALENDDYSDIPDAYVRGYIRSYAKFLSIDPAVVQEKLSVDSTINCPSVSQPARRSKAGGKDAFLRVSIGFLLTLIVAVTLIWWFYPQSDGSANFTAFDPGQLFNSDPEDDSELSLPDESAPDSAAITSSERQEMVETESGSAKDMDVEPDNKIEPAATREEISAENIDEPVTDIALASSSFEHETVAASSPAAAESEVAGQADRLTVQYIEESWTVIKDARDRELLNGLYKSGVVRTISGEAPFRVFLGNSPGVVISINGKKFDQSRFTRSNRTARFELTDSNT